MDPGAPAVTAAPAATQRLNLRLLHPGNFAYVMTTGIPSIGMRLHEQPLLAEILAALALGAWLTLLALSLMRLRRHAAAVKADLLSPRMVFSYFTLVAATSWGWAWRCTASLSCCSATASSSPR